MATEEKIKDKNSESNDLFVIIEKKLNPVQFSPSRLSVQQNKWTNYFYKDLLTLITDR